MRGLSESDEELAEHLLQLEEGGQYRWTGKNGDDKLLHCVRREKGRVIPFEERLRISTPRNGLNRN